MHLEEVDDSREEGMIKLKHFRKGHKQPKKTRKLNKLTKKAFVTLLDEFTQNSTMHGLRYITERKLSYIEKSFWLVVVIASFIMSGFLIHDAWMKWRNNPIIITMNEKLVPVNVVNYPAITICPQIKIKKNTFNFESEANNYRDFVRNEPVVNETEAMRLGRFADIALVCDDDLPAGIFSFPVKNYTVDIDNILEVALDFEDIFLSCRWNTNLLPCRSLFQKVLTREGVCFTINSLDADEIVRSEYSVNDLFLSNKIFKENFSILSPIKGTVNDASPEFSVTLREDPDLGNKSCKRFNTGFVVYFQDPADMPHASILSHTVNLNEIVLLAFEFNTISTSGDLKHFLIDTRQCYFSDEPYLKFFPTYTEGNCRIECLANYTKQLCGCVPFYMPRKNTTRVCPGSYLYCVDVAQILLYGIIRRDTLERFMYLYNYLDDPINVSIINKSKEIENECKCLPTCHTVNYDADLMKQDYDFEYYYDYYCTNFELCDYKNTSYKYAKLEWIFKHPNGIGMTRSSMFGMTDFTAQCGGLLGLFLGFSLLTIIEIFYHVTLRFSCIIRQERASLKMRQ